MGILRINGARIDLRTIGNPSSAPVARILNVGQGRACVSIPTANIRVECAPPEKTFLCEAPWTSAQFSSVVDRDGWLDVTTLGPGAYRLIASQIGGVFIESIDARPDDDDHVCAYWPYPSDFPWRARKGGDRGV